MDDNQLIEKSATDKSISATPEEQLMLLRGLTQTTGALHDAQVTQLKWWAYIALEHCQKFEIHYDHGRKTLAYKLVQFDRKARRPDVQDRCKKLDEAVKWLLGSNFVLTVREGTTVLYRGKKGPVKWPKPKKAKK